jgi:hypothetical protein
LFGFGLWAGGGKSATISHRNINQSLAFTPPVLFQLIQSPDFGIMMIGSLMLGLLVYESRHKGVKEGRLLFFRRLRNLFITALPTLVLFAEYMLRSDMSGDTTVHHVKDSFDYIIHLYSLVTLQSSENVLALFTSITCISVFLAAVILRVKQKGLVPADGLVLFNMLVMLCIIFSAK